MNISQRQGFDEALDLVRRTRWTPGVHAAPAGGDPARGLGASPHAWIANWNRAHAMNERVTGFTHCRHPRFEGVGVRS